MQCFYQSEDGDWIKGRISTWTNKVVIQDEETCKEILICSPQITFTSNSLIVSGFKPEKSKYVAVSIFVTFNKKHTTKD